MRASLLRRNSTSSSSPWSKRSDGLMWLLMSNSGCTSASLQACLSFRVNIIPLALFSLNGHSCVVPSHHLLGPPPLEFTDACKAVVLFLRQRSGFDAIHSLMRSNFFDLDSWRVLINCDKYIYVKKHPVKVHSQDYLFYIFRLYLTMLHEKFLVTHFSKGKKISSRR